MSAPSMKLIGQPSKELWCFLAVYVMCPCDIDLSPIFTKIRSHDWAVMLNIPAYFEVYRPWCFRNMRP